MACHPMAEGFAGACDGNGEGGGEGGGEDVNPPQRQDGNAEEDQMSCLSGTESSGDRLRRNLWKGRESGFHECDFSKCLRSEDFETRFCGFEGRHAVKSYNDSFSRF